MKAKEYHGLILINAERVTESRHTLLFDSVPICPQACVHVPCVVYTIVTSL